ncbi:MAG: hypothetical protein IT304_08340 [Dehalococcoidia bacterium]|nr:hypothetical protein [Dehalococcoidia bacterium]
MSTGQTPIASCEDHLLATLRALPECAPDGRGLGQKAPEEATGFELNLPEYDGYFTWSLLAALTVHERVEALQPGKRNKKRRLVR